ncbi:MAG: TfuA-like protein [Acidobacteriota bacterium]
MNHDVIVFLGPSLPLDAARAVLDADYRPPVAQGDVVRALRDRPRALAVIDGYFERQPAVWHKEILRALSRGVAVYGAASMGALRAAELERFGMIGVGTVFELYRDGKLHDDDEVALAHGPAESGWRAASEAMVDLRATVARAVDEQALEADAADAVLLAAKRRHYSERRWPEILRAVRDAGVVDASRLDALDAWLDGGDGPSRRVALKRRDAEALLHRLRADLEHGLERPRPRWRFQHTLAWDTLRRDALARHGDTGRGPRHHPARRDPVLDLARLEPDAPRLRADATWRAGARHESTPQPGDVEPGLDALRRRHDLATADDIEHFARSQGITPDRLLELVAAEHRARRRADRDSAAIDASLRDLLRLEGRWGALAARARDDDTVLERAGVADPTLDDLQLDPEELDQVPSERGSSERDGDPQAAREAVLWRWFFGAHLGLDEPADPAGWARARGFADLAALRRVAIRARVVAEERERAG